MDIDDVIKETKIRRHFHTHPPEKIYCQRCGEYVMVYKKSEAEIVGQPEDDDFVADKYCSKCITQIVGGFQ